jgi:predicted N-acetyltransferase YhbS
MLSLRRGGFPLSTFVAYRPEWAVPLVALWQEAAGDRYPILPALWAAVTAGDPGFRPADLLVAMEGGVPVGFVLTKRLREAFPGSDRYDAVGWVALMAVAPAHQRRGLGSRLLAAAEAGLKDAGARRVVLGGSFHHVMPGVPAALPGAAAFVEQHGYALGGTVWDVRRDLGEGPALPTVPAAPGVGFRPCAPDRVAALNAFLAASFPGRWARDVGRFLAEGGDPGTVMTLEVDGAIEGFAWLHPPGSPGALRWAGFAPGMAALGPIGVSEAVRGRGLGLGLLVAGLSGLAAQGARDTVIDWTTLLEFYGRVGFEPWLAYRLGEKGLE